jgi:hypothetical protein
MLSRANTTGRSAGAVGDELNTSAQSAHKTEIPPQENGRRRTSRFRRRFISTLRVDVSFFIVASVRDKDNDGTIYFSTSN